MENQNIPYHLKPTFFIKSKTNNKEFAKQYFMILASETTEPALIVRKLVYTNDYELYCDDFDILKKYKDHFLFQQIFSIKLSTLSSVLSVIFTMKNEETK